MFDEIDDCFGDSQLVVPEHSDAGVALGAEKPPHFFCVVVMVNA
jgi:hypothetical protein